MTGLSERLALYGTDEAVEPSRILAAGPYSFVLDAGRIRNFRLNGIELVRTIGFVVRDRTWDTLPLVPEALLVETDGDTVSVEYRATIRNGSAELAFAGKIEMSRGGGLRFEGRATAHGDFETNRAGFVVLYPLQTAKGHVVEVEHASGSRESVELPVLVSPGQPVFDIRSLTHRPMPGVRMNCRLEGEVFEMEDHRNWTDASFKIYSRPLDSPRPYTIRSGETLRQSVAIAVEGRAAKSARAAAQAGAEPIRMRLGAEAGRLPGFGTAMPTGGQAVDGLALRRYAALALDHLVCTVGLTAGPDALQRHRSLIDRLGFRGDLILEAVVSGDDPERDLARLAEDARQLDLKPSHVSVFMAPYLRSYQPTATWPETAGFARLYSDARTAFPGARVGGGMYTHFTELNRQRAAAKEADYVTHTTCPLVHDSDDLSVMQTLDALPDVFHTTRAFAPNIPYRLGPISLGLRCNPGGAPVQPNPQQKRKVLTDDDPRWRGLFGASWMIGYAAEAAAASVDAVAFGSMGGSSSFIAHERGGAHAQGTIFPGFHALSALAMASRARRVPVVFSRPGTRGLGWRDNDGNIRILVANNEDRAHLLSSDIAPAGSLVSRVLDAERVEAGARDPDALEQQGGSNDDPIRLGPYAVALLSIQARG